MLLNRILLVIIFISPVMGGVAECWLEKINPSDQVIVGDTIEVRIKLKTNSDLIQAYDFYLSLDPTYLEILSEEEPIEAYNFNLGWIVFSNAYFNGKIQYIAFKSSQTDFINGEGVVGTFRLKVLNIPSDNNSALISFDNYPGRYTRYMNSEDVEQDFESMEDLSIYIEGYSISPTIPDTVVVPGEILNFDLSPYFTSNIYDASEAIWSIDVDQTVDNVEVSLDTNPDLVIITSSDQSEGILSATITLNVSGQNLFVTQLWNIEINSPVIFIEPYFDVIFSEDTEYYLHFDSLFIDQNNTHDQISVWDTLITKNTPITTEYIDNNLIKISATPNYFGLANIRLFVEEPIGRIIDRPIPIHIYNANDPPILDFTGVSGDPELENTIILFPEETISIDLSQFVTDIDDNSFTWSVEDNEYLNENTSWLEYSILTFSSVADSVLNTNLIVFVDDSDTTVSDTINVEIRSASPKILYNDVLLFSADSTYFLGMDSIIIDPDTPLNQLIWDFSFLSNGVTDSDVTFSFDTTSLVLTINSSHSSNTDGTMIISVQENFQFGSSVDLELLILFFASFDPKILSISTIIVNPDTSLQILDMDTLVYDYNDSPSDISWDIIEISNLHDAFIDSVSHILHVETKSDYFGNDTIKLVATNLLSRSDTSFVPLLVIPYNPYPEINSLPDKDVYWYLESDYLFDLDDYIFDSSTPVQNIEWSATYPEDSIAVSIAPDHRVFVTTLGLTGSVSIIFTAINAIDSTSSDTVTLNIIHDEPPEWMNLINIEMSKFVPFDTLSYSLSDKCSDDLTVDSEKLIYSVQTDPTILSVVIDSLTNVTLALLDTSVTTTSFTFSAEDEQHNVSYSNTVNVNVLNGYSPLWGTLPVISFGNDTTYLSECLESWCYDSDTPDSLLTFSVESISEDLYAEIIQGPGCSSLWLAPQSEIQGTYFLLLHAEDVQGNIASKLVIVYISDQSSPSAGLSYFITPGLNRRLHFILTSDGSVSDISNSFFLDDSLIGSLSFSLIDQQPESQVWNAPYRFATSGLYRLIVDLTDDSFNTAVDSLSLSVAIPNSEGGRLVSSSAKLILQYPNAEYSENQILILNERPYTGELSIDTELTLYSIESNISDDIAFVATFTDETDGSDYYSFYTVVEREDIPVPTFIDKNGKFQASVALNSHFYFGRSLKPAQSVVLPQDYIYSYPNPFNSVINIMFFIPILESVNISVYNILGHRVFSDTLMVPPGLATITWDGRGGNGQNLPTGLYFFHLSAKNKQMTTKITILK